LADPALITTTLLLARLHDSRDEGAWQLFDGRFRGVIVATGLRLGLSRSDAEEAAQETIAQALRDYQAGRYDRSRGRLSSWIVSIARHRIVDLQRARKPHLDLERAMAETRESDVAAAFDQALERRIFEEAWALVRATSNASEATLMAFELTALRSVPAAEAAAQCGLSVDQVYVARNRVSQRLKEAVEKIDRAVRDGL